MRLRKNRTPKRELNTEDEPYDLAKEIFGILGTVRFSLYWVLGTFFWTIITLILLIFFTDFFLNGINGIVVVVDILIGVIIWGLAPPYLLGMIKAIRVLNRWEENYYAYSLRHNIEFSPIRMTNTVEDIIQRLRLSQVYVDVKISEDPKSVQINPTLKGKISSHQFDAVIWTSDSSLIFIEVFGNKEPVDVDRLKRFTEGIQDVIDAGKLEIDDIFVISTSGFSEEALDYAANEENQIVDSTGYSNPMTLIEETKDAYHISWMYLPDESDEL